ncbi:hypothetical protein CORC01_13882 [Colletotrichum orchidophilum]|uniref:Uncharacterized protein n=1 Tax=Colletotrichum orchidophilum TaxID=1209926 RepID=A0A1G4ANP1_9PEZI|nr:uncharacterized protein CORC01_13882 [Colletotrichum orchidophilum]OHE90808.1 hypothetical protein CORC01_13882 [Colletotrichum orchidophilum]
MSQATLKATRSRDVKMDHENQTRDDFISHQEHGDDSSRSPPRQGPWRVILWHTDRGGSPCTRPRKCLSFTESSPPARGSRKYPVFPTRANISVLRLLTLTAISQAQQLLGARGVADHFGAFALLPTLKFQLAVERSRCRSVEHPFEIQQ